jgi:hypothetical protein
MAQKTVKYVGFAEKAGQSRTETFDVDYGIPPVKTPYKLGLLKDGNILIDKAAFDELMLPKWGEGQDKIFVDTLPYVAKTVAQTIPVSNWKALPSQVPTTAGDETVFYRTRKNLGPNRWMEFQHMPYAEFWWNLFGVEEWLLVGDEQWNYVTNPAYVDYSGKLEEYKEKLKSTFILMGKYKFPGLPCQGSWKWYEGDSPTSVIEIPQDCSHPLALANSTGGWKMIYKPMPDYDQENSSSWYSLFTINTVLLNPPYYSAAFRTRRILNY